MRKLNFLSMRMLGVYFLLFAMVCGLATFVENAYSTDVANTAIYHTHWFEFILFMGALSLVYNIIVFKLYRKGKLAIGLFHLGLVLMIMGAGITRYAGTDGQMHIREGQTSATYKSKIENGIRRYHLSFGVRLDQFAIEYYPGSENPSEYRSKVSVVQDGEVLFSDEIYMNHILKYRGYRFFQSSYDPDFHGTILSVNHDPYGMYVSYLGYAFLFIGMFFSLFSKGSRFQSLVSQLNKSVVLLLLGGFLSLPTFVKAEVVDDSVVKAFSEMWVSNGKGRILPMHSMNLDLVQKMTHEKSYDGFSADEIVLNILMQKEGWLDKPIIYVENEEIANILNIEGEYASYHQFFSPQSHYILSEELNKSYAKPLSEQTKYDKKIIAITERVSVYKMIIDGDFLVIYPDPKSPFGKWLTPRLAKSSNDVALLSVNAIFLDALTRASSVEIQSAMKELSAYQQSVGGDIMPSEMKKRVEIVYDTLNIFTRLAPTYATLSILLLAFTIVGIFKRKRISVAINILSAAMLLAFCIHTLGLAMRWYISGHAPMSNGYESMILVSWAATLGGLLFARKSTIALAISTLMAAATLLVAHINSMNPEITALVPVLNSYWLSIHVATITASYGFLSICALVGLFNMSVAAFTVSERFEAIINELTIISKLLMIIGLYLLTIGCFIGAIWANESWGRYWSWDPKETWCLVTIIVYAFIIHMHHIPQLSSRLVYNVSSVWAIASILMTYFGVNYFLGGMHSYAGGEAPTIPMSLYLVVFILLVISVKAFLFQKRRNIT